MTAQDGLAVVPLFSFKDGLICRTQSFLDRESALEAVGLRESAGRFKRPQSG